MRTASTTSSARQPDQAPQNVVLGLLLTVLPFFSSAPVAAQQAPPLGTAATFAVLGGSTVTNSGPSAITGDVGVWPGLAMTGFPPATVTGTIHAGDAIAAQAQADTTIAYNALAGAACNTNLTGQDLGGLTLVGGVYCFSTSAQLTGTVTLNGSGNPNSVFIFQIGTTLTTASGSSVNLVNGAEACKVFWQVGSSATLGSTTAFAGTIIALASITMVGGATLQGRALARNGATTLDTNAIQFPSMAEWHNYGFGWPGTFGIPSFVLSAPPVIGTTVNLVVQNTYVVPTYGLLLWGGGPVVIPTAFGGSLMAQPLLSWPQPLALGLQVIPMAIPLDPALVCFGFNLQILVYDKGASHFAAFTRGLHIEIGL
ncbi:MAG: ice-binding family protein [Planctomycetota bacterium]|nr:ice-binding family protein [Planctomycetota bacterium]